MSQIAPPSSPMMAVPPAETPDVPAPLLTDDIEDPPVPAGLVAPAQAAVPVPQIPDALMPLAQGFCQYLQGRMHAWIMDEHRQIMTAVDASLAGVRDWAKEVFQANEHAQYTLGDALAKLHEHGANLVHAKADPYTAHLTARTPHGFALTLTIEKGTSGELIEELGRLEGWLVANGYTITEGAAA